MKSSHNNQNGIKLIMTLMVLGVVAIVAIGGWLIWLQFNNEDTGPKGSPVVLEVPVFDTGTTLPEGWAIEIGDAPTELLVSSQSGCSVDTKLFKDDQAKLSGATSYAATKVKNVIASLEAKGYVITQLPAESVMIDRGDKPLSYPTSELVIKTGEVGDDLLPSRETLAYVVGNGQYAEVKAVCDGEEYTPADKEAIKNVVIPGIRLNIPENDPEYY